MQTAASSNSTTFQEILENTEKQKKLIREEQDKPITVSARNMTFAGLTVAGGLTFILFAGQIITGMAALLLTGAVTIGGFYGIRFLKSMDPLIRQKTKNAQMKWMMDEARRNSIEQLQNLALAKRQRLEDARTARNKMKAVVQKMRDKLDTSKDKNSSMYKKQENMLKTVESACIKMAENIDRGAKATKQFEEKVEEYRNMDQMSDLFGQAMSMFDRSGTRHMEEMLSLTAFDSIEEDFNEAIISIDGLTHDMAIDGETI